MTLFAGVPDPEALRARSGWFVGFGVVFVIVGLFALGNAVDATIVTTVLIGVMLLIAGLAQIVAALAGGSPSLGGRILAGAIGVLYLLVGFDLVADPIKGAITLTVVIALMLIIGGVIRIVGALAERSGQWLLVLVVGVINVLLGMWLWSGIPFTGVAIGVFVGLDLLMAGITWIVLGWSARSQPGGALPA